MLFRSLGRVRNSRPNAHVLIVDDGSPDGTGDLADELAASDSGHVHVMHRTAKDGLGAAYLAGIAEGVWSGPEEAASAWREEAAFTPRMAAEEVAARRATWARAVERARDWDRSGPATD